MPVLIDQGCSLGWRRSGRTVLGYSLYADGVLVQARQLVDVVEVISSLDPGDLGNYECAPDSGLSIPSGFHGTIVWDDPATGVTDSHTIDLSSRGPMGEGGGAGGAGDSLTQAIVDRVRSIDSLMALLPGDFWFGPPDEEADENPPYGTFSLILDRVEDYYAASNEEDGNTNPIGGSEETGRRTFFQFNLVGTDYEELETIHLMFKRYFNPRMAPFLIAGRLFVGWWNDRMEVDFGDAPSSPSGRNFVVLRWDAELLSTTIGD